MNVHEFLDRWQTSMTAFQRSVRSAIHLGDDDVLILAGSLVEGIGTSSSDIDLILLSSREDIDFNACLTDVAVVVGNVLADIRVVSFAQFEGLLQRFEAWSSSPRAPRRAFEFTTDERKLLHRISTGIPIHGERFYDTRIRNALSDTKLVRHKLDWARHLGSTFLVDLRGLFEDNRYAEMIPIAQELCNQSVDAILCGWGVTNPSGKWRTAYLSKLPSNWHRRMPNVMGSRSAADAVFDIGRAPRQDTRDQIIGFVSRICAFARMAFIWSEDAVLRGETTTVRWQERGPLGGAGAAMNVPVLHFDLDITVDDEAVWITRLNQPGCAERVPPELLAVLVWSDGETTVDRLRSSPASIGAALQFITAGDYRATLPHDEAALDQVLRGSRTTPCPRGASVVGHQLNQV